MFGSVTDATTWIHFVALAPLGVTLASWPSWMTAVLPPISAQIWLMAEASALSLFVRTSAS
ncbi:hypothetical protein D3C86_1851010 [compost metagenome]